MHCFIEDSTPNKQMDRTAMSAGRALVRDRELWAALMAVGHLGRSASVHHSPCSVLSSLGDRVRTAVRCKEKPASTIHGIRLPVLAVLQGHRFVPLSIPSECVECSFVRCDFVEFHIQFFPPPNKSLERTAGSRASGEGSSVIPPLLSSHVRAHTSRPGIRQRFGVSRLI